MARRIPDPSVNKTYSRRVDQYGRPWGVPMEMGRGANGSSTLAPCGLWEPIGWKAPYPFPQRPEYFRTDPTTPHLVTVDYGRMAADQREALKRYEKELRDAGAELHGHAFDESAPPTKQMLARVGPPPWPWQLAEAARRGDRWILGLSDRVNEKLRALLPVAEDEADEDFDETWLDAGEAPAPRRARQPAPAGG